MADEPLNQQQQNAYDYLKQLLNGWGIGELAPDALQLIQEGHDAAVVPGLLQETQAYKKRFAGNEIRKQKGMPVLSPAEYLSTEQAYRRIMESNGLPQGFYDQPSDFSDWIGKDVAPQEISQRVGYAVDAAHRLDAGTKRAFQEYYGVNTSQLTAFFLDQKRALPIVEQQARAATVGASAMNSGVNVNRQVAERLATSNVADQNLAQQMQSAVQASKDVGKLSQLYKGDQYGIDDAANEAFFNDAEAKRRRQRLTAQEQATFNGNSGVGRSSLDRNHGGY